MTHAWATDPVRGQRCAACGERRVWRTSWWRWTAPDLSEPGPCAPVPEPPEDARVRAFFREPEPGA